MSREEIEGRVRNEIQREINHETWRGLRVESYRFKVPIPPELRGSEWDWGYCSHWSTHEGAEPLVSLFDVAQAIAAVRAEAANAIVGQEALLKAENAARLDLQRLAADECARADKMRDLLTRARWYVADALEAHEHTDGRDLLREIDAVLPDNTEAGSNG